MNIGFVGLGLMGQPMVERLLQAGFTLHVFSESEEAMAALQQQGALPGS